MPVQHHRQPKIWWLSGSLAVLGTAIAIFASQAWLVVTLLTVVMAVIVTVWLGAVLAQVDR